MSSYGTGCERRIQPAAPGGSRIAARHAQAAAGPTEPSREVSYALYFPAQREGRCSSRAECLSRKAVVSRALVAAFCSALGLSRQTISAPCRARPRPVAVPLRGGTQSPRGSLAPGWPCRVRLLGRSPPPPRPPPSPPGAEANACLIHKTCLWTN